MNLNSFECYMALRKVQKPVIKSNNCVFDHEENLSTVGSDGSNSSNASGQHVKKSFFKKLVAKIRKGKDVETQTTRKNTVRFFSVENGRVLVIKSLLDKLDGDKYSVVRQFPHFQRSMDDRNFTLPTITWNAKVSRVYKIQELQGLKLLSRHDDMSRICFCWLDPSSPVAVFQKPYLKDYIR